MAFKYNPFIKDRDFYGVRIVSADPASGVDGEWILNTTDHKLKVWFNSQWNVTHTLTVSEITAATMAVAHTALTDGIGNTTIPFYKDATELPKTSYDLDKICFYGVNQPNNSGAKPHTYATNQYAAALFSAGLRDARYEVAWNVVSTGATSYNWNAYNINDDITALRTNGATIQIETGYTPMHYTRQRFRTPPALKWVDTAEEKTFANDQIQLNNVGIWRNSFSTEYERRGPFLMPSSVSTVSVSNELLALYKIAWDDPRTETYSTRTHEQGYLDRYCARTEHYPIDLSTLSVWVDETGTGSSYELWTRVDEMSDATTDQKVYVADHTGRIAFKDSQAPTDIAHKPANGSRVKATYNYYPTVYDGDGVDYSVNVSTGVITRQSPETGLNVPNMEVDFSSGDPDTYFTWTGAENVTETVADGALKMITTANGTKEYYARQTITGDTGDYSVVINVSNYSVTPSDAFAYAGLRLSDSVSGDYIIWGARAGVRAIKYRLNNGAHTYDSTYSGSLGTAFKLEISRSGATTYCKAYDSGDSQVGSDVTTSYTFNPDSVDIYGWVYTNKAQTWWVEDFTFTGAGETPHTEDTVLALYACADTDKYETYGEDLATQYGDRCKNFEFGNEIGSGFKWTWNAGLLLDSLAVYAICFNALKTGIKSVVADAQIANAGWSDSEAALMTNLYDYIPKEDFDAAAWHPYKFLFGTVAAWKSVHADAFKNRLIAADDADKPMWAGEMSAACGALCGSNANPPIGLADGPNERTQLEWTIQMIMILRLLGVQRISLWPVTDLEVKGTNESNKWGGKDGLFYTSGGAVPNGYKPVFYGVKNLGTCKGVLIDLDDVETIDTVVLTSPFRERIASVKVKTSITATDDASKPPLVTAVLISGTTVFVVTVATGDADLVTERWTATCQSDGSTFIVEGSISGSQGSATKESSFTSNNGVCTFTIPAGTYTEGQIFTWETFKGDGFTEADDYTVTETGAGDITISFTAVSARYVLLEITRADGESEFDLKQIQVLNTADTNVASGKYYTAEGWQS